jgi:hypothetical protein
MRTSLGGRRRTLAAVILISALCWWAVPRPVTAASNQPPASLIGVNVDNVTLAYQVQNLSTVVHIGAARVAWTDPPDYTSRTYTLPDGDITALARYHVQILDILFSCTILNDQNRLIADEARMDHVHALVGQRTPVWWEFGNEVIRSCSTNNTPQAYTVMWNMLIPTLKQRYPQDSFGGPSGSGADGAWIAYFVDHARPAATPDFISWHEYAGSGSESKGALLSMPSGWSWAVQNVRNYICRYTHYACARTHMTPPPVIISEWGYGYWANCRDDKHDDPSFMHAFTVAALQSFVAAKVRASFMMDMGPCPPTTTNPQPKPDHASLLLPNGSPSASGQVVMVRTTSPVPPLRNWRGFGPPQPLKHIHTGGRAFTHFR